MAVGIAAPEKMVRPRVLKALAWALIAVCAVAGILIGLLAANWPFSREAITKKLERASSAQVQIRGFHTTYFPYPGCVAENVTFQLPAPAGGKAPDPVITIGKLTIKSTFFGLFRKPGRIAAIIAEGLRVHVPAGGANLHSQNEKQSDQVVIEDLRAENAVLEVDSGQDREQPLVFQIHRINFRNLNANNTVPFEVSLRLPVPPGEVESYGWIGPANDKKNMRDMPISGAYVLKNADLGVFESLGGKVSSQGNFSGTLGRLNVEGNMNTPDFEVKEAGHRIPISTQFRGVVDLKNGDVSFPSLQAKLGRTSLAATATILGKNGGNSKTVTLNVLQGHGDVQDLVLLFSHAPHSAITGPITFHARAVLPPEHRPFKERVQLTGDFKIDPAQFTSANTQEHVDQLSERAEGQKDKDKGKVPDEDADGHERVLTALTGQVLLKNGVANFSHTSFSVPGALAGMNGDYSLVSKRLDFHGKMRMQATVSQATKGVKSFFLKVADPFFKKKGAGAEVSISMTGTYDHPHFTVGPQ